MDNRKKLLEIIERNDIPLPPKEAKEHVDNLSDEEVELLVSTYEDLGGAEGVIEEVIKEVEPEKYKKVREEYEGNMKLDKEDFEKEMQEIESVTDIEKDKVEDEIIKESKNAVDEMNNVIDNTEDAREELIKISNSNFQ
jgi:hypothetical protein